MFFQCGRIRHEILPSEVSDLSKEVSINESRNKLIAEKTGQALSTNRFPLLVFDRKEHLDVLGALIKESNPNVELILLGETLTNKQRKTAFNKIKDARARKILS